MDHAALPTRQTPHAPDLRRGLLRRLVAHDPEEASEILRPRCFRFVPRRRGPVRFEVEHVALGAATLRVERIVGAMLVEGRPAEGTQGLFAHATLGGSFRYMGTEVGPDRLLLTHDDDGWCGVVPERMEAAVLTFERDALRRRCALLGLADPAAALGKGWVLPRSVGFAGRVRALIRAAERLPPGAQAGRLEEAALDLAHSALVTAAPDRPLRVSAANRRRALTRAVEYAFDHLGAPPRVVDLCRVAGTSVRTLEYAFREVYETTPQRFLKLARLSRARRDLLRATRGETTVLAVGMHWGF